ncbi:hypothetical protein DY000_02023658 [Brassica cretica]|uniref:Uncharacterized protein n=1 Tax=Brassica cretica TaxID=69181 RepID=A0ABQ7EA48_BRACR|nr:hypothetical protein DY000_02023658 [Brassica cretica]
MNKREEKKKVTQVMSKRDGEEMKLVRDGVKRQRRRLLSQLMLTALGGTTTKRSERKVKGESGSGTGTRLVEDENRASTTETMAEEDYRRWT